MENLTKNQQSIVESLVAEFTNINEKYKSTKGNIFAHLVDELKNDNKRIEEIKALDLMGKYKLQNQIDLDFLKFSDMFEELGIKIIKSYPNVSECYFELVTIKGNKKIKDYQNANILKWEYVGREYAEVVLGYRREFVDGYYINFRKSKFDSIQDLFESATFQDYLKQLIQES